MPELEEKQETQEEFGWENLDRFASEQTSSQETVTEPQEPSGGPPAEAAPQEVAQQATQDAAAAQAVGATKEMTDEQVAQAQPQDVVYTLPGGKKITKQELVDDPQLLQKLVTHSNQVSHFQRLAEQRKSEMEAMQAEHRRVLDQYTAWQMQQQAAQQMQQQGPSYERPPTKALETAFAPHLDSMVESGRLTQDQRDEFGNVISEYLFDHQLIFDTLSKIYQQGVQRFGQLESRLEGEVVPATVQWQQQQAISHEAALQAEAASIPGYESLADPNEWNRLKTFVYEKMAASPKDQNGKPTFDPILDATTATQLYDAMTGAQMRAMIAAEKVKAQAGAQRTGAMVAGETSARAGSPPRKRPQGPITEEEDAMNFGDPSMTIG